MVFFGMRDHGESNPLPPNALGMGETKPPVDGERNADELAHEQSLSEGKGLSDTDATSRDEAAMDPPHPEDVSWEAMVPMDRLGQVEGEGPSSSSPQPRVNSITGADGDSIEPPPVVAVPKTDGSPESKANESKENETGELVAATPRADRPDALMQSVLLLVTMLIMLAAARFAVPRIVEEIRYAWHRGELRAEYETGVDGLRNVSLDVLSDAYQMVTASVGPSVVHIDVQREMPEIDEHLMALLPSGQSPNADQGSGVIVDPEGYILTNRHVIADGNDITVTLSDGREVDAVVVGADKMTDLAVLKINADRLFSIPWGDSDLCRVGSPVWAVGSPFGLDRTVTFGILSGKHRVVRAGNQHGAHAQYQDFMQSDVAVNPGNSGGPLVDSRGTLVGINTAIVGDTYQGVSFSIPSNIARQVYDQLLDRGHVERGWLGVSLLEVAQDQVIGDDLRLRGALVSEVLDPRSPAGRAGLQSGDIIRFVGREGVADVGHLMRLIGNAMKGTEIDLGVVRGSTAMRIPVVLGARPGP